MQLLIYEFCIHNGNTVIATATIINHTIHIFQRTEAVWSLMLCFPLWEIRSSSI